MVVDIINLLCLYIDILFASAVLSIKVLLNLSWSSITSGVFNIHPEVSNFNHPFFSYAVSILVPIGKALIILLLDESESYTYTGLFIIIYGVLAINLSPLLYYENVSGIVHKGLSHIFI